MRKQFRCLLKKMRLTSPSGRGSPMHETFSHPPRPPPNFTVWQTEGMEPNIGIAMPHAGESSYVS